LADGRLVSSISVAEVAKGNEEIQAKGRDLTLEWKDVAPDAVAVSPLSPGLGVFLRLWPRQGKVPPGDYRVVYSQEAIENTGFF
jgi:hypothetical protein